jgi:hypothetical protein
MEETLSAGLIAVGLAASAVALWLAIFHALARVGGWHALARAYPPHGPGGASFGATSAGTTFRMRSAGLRHQVNYNGCVTFAVSPLALRLSLPFPFSFGHPPIEVPWGEITAAAERMLWARIVTLRCARVPSVPVRIRRAFAEELARASAGALRLPRADEGTPAPLSGTARVQALLEAMRGRKD